MAFQIILELPHLFCYFFEFDYKESYSTLEQQMMCRIRVLIQHHPKKSINISNRKLYCFTNRWKRKRVNNKLGQTIIRVTQGSTDPTIKIFLFTVRFKIIKIYLVCEFLVSVTAQIPKISRVNKV